MNRLFDASLVRGRPEEAPLGSAGWVPLADVYETPEAFVAQVELPGVGPEDVDVHVDGDTLTLKGERRMPGPGRPDSFHRMERSYGPFSRSFRFPEDVDPERVTAQFRDGLLRLDLPKVRAPGAWRLRTERGD